MKRFFMNLFVCIVVTSLLLLLSHTGIIPWQKMIPTYRIPNLKGLDKNTAEIICRVKNISMEIDEEVYSDEYEKGLIISQIPEEYSIERQPELQVIISKGSQSVYVPDLKGLNLEQAKKMLESVSLAVGATSYINSDVEKGKVVSSFPDPGAEVSYVQPIDIVISKGQNLITVPKIVGKKLVQAQKILTSKGLVLGYVKKTTDIERMFGIILKQYPRAWKKVKKGTAVTVVVNEEEED